MNLKNKDKKIKMKKKRKSALKAATFSPYHVKNELKKVRWAKWNTVGSNVGMGRNLADTLIFCAFFAVCSMLFTTIISAIAKVL